MDIFDEYELIRTRTRAERDERVKEVYSRFPRLAEIKRKQNLAGAQNMAEVLKNPDKADSLNAGLKETLARLDKERAEIIGKNNIDPDFDKIRCACEKCRDTGYIGQKKCSCYTKKLIDNAYSKSNLGELLKTQTFELFNPLYYPDTPLDGDTTVRSHMLSVRDRCLAFCEDFKNRKKGLLFYGSAGLGKTFLSSCIAKRLMDSGYAVIYITASQLFTAYDAFRFNRGDMRINRQSIDSFKGCDLLIIDDLGTEAATRYTESYLFDLVNERIIRGGKMVISTNLTVEKLSAAYSTRFTSRLYEHFNFLRFEGTDIRIKKAAGSVVYQPPKL